jgi:hypothetical protein
LKTIIRQLNERLIQCNQALNIITCNPALVLINGLLDLRELAWYNYQNAPVHSLQNRTALWQLHTQIVNTARSFQGFQKTLSGVCDLSFQLSYPCDVENTKSRLAQALSTFIPGAVPLQQEEMRGVWLRVMEYIRIGLGNFSEAIYSKKSRQYNKSTQKESSLCYTDADRSTAQGIKNNINPLLNESMRQLQKMHESCKAKIEQAKQTSSQMPTAGLWQNASYCEETNGKERKNKAKPG